MYPSYVAFGLNAQPFTQLKPCTWPHPLSSHTVRRRRFVKSPTHHIERLIVCQQNAPNGVQAHTSAPSDGADSGPVSGHPSPEQVLTSWLLAHDFELRDIELRRQKGSARGMYATSQIDYGQTLIRIPRNRILLINTFRRGVPNLHVFPIKVDSDFWRHAKWYIRLAVKLLDEIARCDTSSFVPYIDALPKNPTSPIWELHRPDIDAAARDNVRAQLQSHGLWATVSEFMAVVDDAHRLLTEALQSEGGAQMEIISKTRFVWAVCIAVSRAFALPRGPVHRPPDEELVDEWACTGGVDIGETHATPSSTATKEERRQPIEFAMIPGLDMINHWTGSNSRLLYRSQSETYKICAGTASSAGQEVFVSYGAKGNDELGLFYGVAEAHNPASIVRVYDLEEWTTKQLGRPVGGGIGLDIARGGQRSQILKRAGLLNEAETYGLRADGTDADLERILRVALATDGEADTLEKERDKHLYERLGKSINLRNEVAVWDALIEWSDRTIRSISLTDDETARVEALIAARGGDGPVGVAWELHDPECVGQAVFKWEKVRVLQQAKSRMEHFKKVSLAVGTVCTVLVPPTQSTLRTKVFDGVDGSDPFGVGAGLRAFNISHQDIEAEIEGGSS